MSQKHILIIDDDEKSRKLVRDLLQANGYATVEGTTGEDALGLAKKHKPALILMDIRLPELSGLDASRGLKADPETSGIPIVALTAFAMAADKEETRCAGCSGYIAKPIDTREFVRTVESFMTK